MRVGFPMITGIFDRAMRNESYLVESAFYDSQIFLDDPLAFAAEFFSQLILNRLDQPLFREPLLLDHLRGGEESALKRDALHA